MSYQNGTWSGHDLTHHFHDDRASISYSSTNGGMQQNRPLQLIAAPTVPQQPLQPPPPQVREPSGSPVSSSRLPIRPDMSDRPITEQANWPHFKLWQSIQTPLTLCIQWSNTGLP